MQQYIKSLERPPDMILVQETHAENAPSLPGYRAHASPPSARERGKGEAQGVCTFVRKGITFVTHNDLLRRSAIEYCATEVVIGKKKKESVYFLNVYSNPGHRQQKFKMAMHKMLKLAGRDTVAMCSDFNAAHKELGYSRTTAKGKALLEAAEEAGFVLYSDEAVPTRIGTSITHDTSPDLSFVRKRKEARGGVAWKNTGQNLGSDHFIIELDLPASADEVGRGKREHKLTNWDRFRGDSEELARKSQTSRAGQTP